MFNLKNTSSLAMLVLALSACGSLKKGSSRPSNEAGKPTFEHELLNEKEEASKEHSQGNAQDPDEKTSNGFKATLEAFINDWYGTPHRMGGMSKSGVDCSGFVIIAYQEVFGREFHGRRAEDIFGEMKALKQEELAFGDLVFFKVKGRRIDHVGIYMGDGEFAHTSSSRGVMISKLSNPYWSKRFFKGGRYQS